MILTKKTEIFLIWVLFFSQFLNFGFKDNNIFPKISQTSAIFADHNIVNKIRLNEIPDSAIIDAKNTLHIAYGHTSHGSQITTGMAELSEFMEGKGGTEGLYNFNDGVLEGALDLDDYFVSGDLGNPDRVTWAQRTRDYLDEQINSDVNVVMWSWCGQANSNDPENINIYLNLMNALEVDYPEINFIYMTGHLVGTGEEGDLNLRNEQIREYCNVNNKILYDFADIESYNPDGEYFLDRNADDACNYDGGGNWAAEWCDENPNEWYICDSAHSHELNANMKAYAAWWLFAVLAGWENSTSDNSTESSSSSTTNTDKTDTNPSQTNNNTSEILDNQTFVSLGIGMGILGIVILVFGIMKKQL